MSVFRAHGGSFRIHVSGPAQAAVDAALPSLVTDLVASGIMDENPTLWGAEAESEAAKRLGWIDVVTNAKPLIPAIYELRDRLRGAGVNHIVLGGMGGSSLAPEVITNTEKVALTILDTTDPGQVLAALRDRLETTAVVISSKSGSTLETDSHRRIYEKSFRDAGIDPASRIVVVTDPGSPLDTSAREAGYTVFNADPNVGGRYSALTAFGLVPAGLAGVDLEALIIEAEATSLDLALDSPENLGLVLGAALAGSALAGAKPVRNKIGLVGDGSELVGFGDWAEQLIAESTGKLGLGLLPVVLGPLAPELDENLADLQVVRFVDDATAHHHREKYQGDILVSGSLGAQFLVWEFAVAVAGRLLGINPFDQPDVEAAKVAARALLDSTPAPTPPVFTIAGVEVRATGDFLGHLSGSGGSGGSSDEPGLTAVIDALLSQIGPDGYLAVQAYLNRVAVPQLQGIRELLAARAGREVTFGWGPRFLHSTGQYHKGGPAVGVFLQITAEPAEDLQIPDRPFTFGQLIAAQAAGDASVLGQHSRPVLTLTLSDPESDIPALFAAIDA